MSFSVAPRVSVVLPVCNVEQHLGRCLDSVLGQTLKEIEIIAVDDGSTDGSPAILDEYALRDPRLKIIRQQNAGAGAARNAGLDAATGRWVFFHDPDDWSDPRMLERLVDRAEDTFAEVVFAPWMVHGGGDGSLVHRRGLPLSLTDLPGSFTRVRLGESLFTTFGYCPWNKLVERELLVRNGVRFQEIPRANDLYFSCAVLVMASRIAIVNEPLYHYRDDGAADGGARTDRHPFCSLDALAAVKAMLVDRGLYGGLSAAFRVLAARVCTTKPSTFIQSVNSRDYYDRIVSHYNAEFELPGLIASQVGEHLFGAYCVMSSGGDYAEYMREMMLSYKRKAEAALDNHYRSAQEAGRLRKGLKAKKPGLSAAVSPLSSTLSPVKRIRAVVKQFLPYGMMRRQVRHYNLELPVRGGNAVTRRLWDLVPYGLVLGKRLRPVVHIGPETFPAPWYIRPRLRSIENARRKTTPDLYVVTGQLNSRTNEAIDSLTFFEWLQTNGIPSKYIVWKKHPLYAKLMQGGHAADVVGLNGNGVDDFEILKHSDMLVRARAFVQESAFLPHPLQSWLRDLPGCRYVFLGHGPCGIATISRRFFSRFNDFNATSERERLLVDEDLSNLIGQPMNISFVGGMARYDRLRDESDRSGGEFIVFVMFTWRDYFGDNLDMMKNSMYWKGIMELLSKTSRDRLAGRRVRFVVSLHHHLVNHMGSIDMGEGITFADTTEISYWIRHAHACVTDFSSVSFDFMFQHKPTLYWITDKNDPTLNPDDVNGGGKVRLAVSLQKNFYNICESCEDVLSLLEKYADSGFALEPEKAAIADTYFTYRKDFCRHIYEEIEKRLKS